MTLANKITLLRILLIPVFIGFALYYAQGVRAGTPDETLRYTAIVVFLIASLSDAVDGWVARHFDQHTKLGVILDPLADKLLVLSAVCVLTFSAWPHGLPVYFVILSISREIFTIVGAFVIKFAAGKVTILPHWSGKVSTCTQLIAIAAAMFSLGAIVPWATALASVFVVGSGTVYVLDAIRQISTARHGKTAS
ncbi:MAG: CDP-alcohol phosphatidyltransferase family protein [Roseimicrobium sp.]